MNIKEIDKQYVANTYARFPLHLEKGNGCYVYDETGKEYIDLGTGIAVNIFGVADKEWKQAVEKQLSLIPHASNLYYTEPCTLLAKMLCEKTGMKKVFFGNSGAEANECAIKVARRYAAKKHGSDCYTIITLKNSFHGRTITTLAATGQDVFHEDFLPLTPGFVYAQANNLDEVRKLTEENKCAAIMFECVQGEGGVMPLSPDFVQGLADIAKEKDILLICDEVQTGNGRCGQLYAFMHYGITPDIFTTAKGLGGGLPIGAAVMSEKLADVLDAGSHGSTFGGNPVCCAGALNILSRIDEKLLEGVRERSAYIKTQLEGVPGVESVSGLGLMLGIKTTKPAGDVISNCMEKGVLVIKAKDKVRLLPPLNIPMDALEKAIEVIKEALK